MANTNRKNIVLCLDGTGCQFRENNTNVVKLYRVLERDNNRQILYYDPGVGTLGDPAYKTPLGKQVTRVLGIAFGRGVIRNLEEAYSFLMEHYQDGDRIFMFGFSRGAYTARALAALIRACGLLDSGCQNLIPYAMQLFRSQPPPWDILAKFKATYGRDCTIHFLGLWDTVKSFGWVYDPIFLPYTTNNERVEVVRHAMAIDERRNFFQPMPWGSLSKDTKQVWFAGVHGDVGGGFPEPNSGLAKITLEWMIEEARTFNLLIQQQDYEQSVLGKNTSEYTAPNSQAELHNSLVGGWRLMQSVPRMRWDPDEKRRVLRCPSKIRQIPEKAILHVSVVEKLKSGQYQPENLGLRTYDPSHIQEALQEKQYRLEPANAVD